MKLKLEFGYDTRKRKPDIKITIEGHPDYCDQLREIITEKIVNEYEMEQI